MEFNEAKQVSLAKWKRHLEEYPNIETRYEGSYHPAGKCGFCVRYLETLANNCENCPLYPAVCQNHGGDGRSLYHRIKAKLMLNDKRGLKSMIQRMVREIQKAEEV